MSSLAELLPESAVVIEEPSSPPPGLALTAPASPVAVIEDAQIRSLVERLFSQPEVPLRHVGFVAADSDTEIAPLCSAVAHVLAEKGSHDIGLVDASPCSEPLHITLGLMPGDPCDSTWPVCSRLQLVPRQSWVTALAPTQISDSSLRRLEELNSRFDRTVLCCGPASWMTPRLAGGCDGVVLVLTASKTRRMAAARVSEQLQRAGVHLLGSVLTARRFPVPAGLYRNL